MSNTQEKQLLEQESPRHSFDRRGKVITVSSAGGGIGKTTTSLLLGSVLADKKSASQDNLKVCVVDLDTFDGQVGFVLNKTYPTSLNIALSSTPLDEEFLWENLVYSESMGFHSLLAPVRSATAPYTDASFYSKIFQLLRTMFDVIVVDTGADINETTYNLNVLLYGISDKVILMGDTSKQGVDSLTASISRSALPAPRGYNFDLSKAHLVFNHGSRMKKKVVKIESSEGKLILEGKVVSESGILDQVREWSEISPDSELAHNFFNENAPVDTLESPLLDDIERIVDTQILPLL